MSKTKAGKTTKGSRKSQPKYLGIKKYAGEIVKPGTIIIRQRGTKFKPGTGVSLGRDYTIFATIDGKVKFYDRTGRKFITVTPTA